MGLCFLVIAVYIIYVTVVASNPRLARDKGTVHKHSSWRRSLVFFHTSWFMLFEFLLVLISRQPAYQQNVQMFSLGMKIAGGVAIYLLDIFIADRLATAPFRMCQETLIKTLSLGTTNFSTFVINYVLLVLISSFSQIATPALNKAIPFLKRKFVFWINLIEKIKRAILGRQDGDDEEGGGVHMPADVKNITTIIEHQFRNA